VQSPQLHWMIEPFVEVNIAPSCTVAVEERWKNARGTRRVSRSVPRGISGALSLSQADSHVVLFYMVSV
jgi:hypothetical protein